MTGEESNHEAATTGTASTGGGSDIASVFNEKDKEYLSEAEESFRKNNFESLSEISLQKQQQQQK